jgi:NodT family efflux transporter outer membrane factor (OMF) lipoprotein
VLAAVLGLAGCAAGPDFHAPAAPPVDRYTGDELPFETAGAEVAGGQAQRLVPGREVPARWWSAYGSPQLDALVDAALQANPDLRAADAALRAARELALAQRSALWPTVDAHFTPTRQSLAGAISSPLASNATLYSLHTAQLSIGYAADVFGGNQRQWESAQAQADAQRFQREAAYLSLTANVVVAAIQAAGLREQIATTHELIDVASRQLEMVHRQQKAGIAGAGEVTAQDVVVAQARATLPPLEKQLAQQLDQLAALTGRLPAEAAGGPDLELRSLALPRELPLTLPSRLVERRPDIQAAQAQWHAASAQIGVAQAARLPNIALSANAGSASEMLSRLFKAGSGFWSIGADLAQPVFNAGALANRQRAAEAAYEQAAAQYQGTVLGAFQNVADALHAIDADARALAAAVDFETAAQRSFHIAQRQWKAGAISYPSVLVAQQAHAQAAIALTQARAARYVDTTALFQALGGDWQERDVAAANPSAP